MKNKVEIGYSTAKVASKETIHLLKKRKLTAESTSTSKLTYQDHLSSVSKSADMEYEKKDESTCLPTRKYYKSKIATNMVTSTEVLTNKAAKICKQLSCDGIYISTPSHAAVY